VVEIESKNIALRVKSDLYEKYKSLFLKSFGMRYARPYQKDYRRADNAEDTLKKT